MQNLQHTAGQDDRDIVYVKIESAPANIQKGWNFLTTEEITAALIVINSQLNIVDYLDQKLALDHLPSSTGWEYKTHCPFHKGGKERSASLFLNREQNRYYCQACGAGGGIVEYISRSYGRPYNLVVEHIYDCINGKDISIDTTIELKKNQERKLYQDNLLKLSAMYNEFLKKNIDNEDAICYINKCMSAFDVLCEDRENDIQNSIVGIVSKFALYISKYNCEINK